MRLSHVHQAHTLSLWLRLKPRVTWQRSGSGRGPNHRHIGALQHCCTEYRDFITSLLASKYAVFHFLSQKPRQRKKEGFQIGLAFRPSSCFPQSCALQRLFSCIHDLLVYTNMTVHALHTNVACDKAHKAKEQKVQRRNHQQIANK